MTYDNDESLNILFRERNIVLSEYTDLETGFIKYTISDVTDIDNLINISVYKTLSEGIREFYRYTHRLNWH